MHAIKQQLFSGWNLLRWVRLFIGVALVVEAFSGGNGVLAIAAGILLLQVFTNSGCAGGSCAIPKKKTNTGILSRKNK